MILTEAENHSTHAYLQTLQTLHSATASLIASLHRFDEQVMVNLMKKPTLTYMLNRSFEDLFVPYLEGERYIKVEYKWLNDEFAGLLSPFREFHANHAKMYKKNKNGNAILISPRDAIGVLSVTQMLGMVGALDVGRGSIMSYEQDGFPVNLHTAMRMLQFHLEPIDRGKELWHPTLL